MRSLIRIIALAACLGLVVVAGQASFGFSGGGRTYVVRPGDSLWAISQADHLTVAQLASANGMRPSDILLIGRTLVIPSSAPAPAASPVALAEGNSETFCATFTPTAGPRGVLPYQLSVSPERLVLRPYFVEWADTYGVSPALVEAIAWQESGWQAGVVSSAQAVGIGQLLPSTAQFIASRLVGLPLNITSASDNIRMSAAFLAYLSHQESGNLCATIASYYEGPVNLSKFGVFPETVSYVASVEALLPRFE